MRSLIHLRSFDPSRPSFAFLVTARGFGVRDAQARLSLAAVIAESFENPSLGHYATEVDAVHAERRALATGGVAPSRKKRRPPALQIGR